MKLTVVIERDGEGYLSLCPELDVTSQGKTIEEARDNLREASELSSSQLHLTKSSSGCAARCL